MGLPEDATPPPDKDDDPAFALLFRSWIILVMLVLCASLLQYLLLRLSG